MPGRHEEPAPQPACDRQRATAGTLVRVDTPDGVEELAAGPSDLRTGTELEAGAAFRVASLTKMVTATVVLQLAEEGEVDLDGDVFEVIPEGAVSRPCLEHQQLDTCAFVRSEPLFPPGTGRAYSNTGYLLLGEVIEAVTGDPLEAVHRQRVLDPLAWTTRG